MSTVQELRAMLAAAEAAEAAEAEATAAAQRVTAVVDAAASHLAAIVSGAAASGLAAPDLAAIVAAAIERAAPIAPEHLAAIVAPDAAPEMVVREDDRRRRQSVAGRDWARVTSGSIWDCTLAGQSGRVKITTGGPDGPRFTATTGARGTYASPSRAVQAACGNPTGAGRNGEATVNGYAALTIVAGHRPDGSAIVVNLATALRP